MVDVLSWVLSAICFFVTLYLINTKGFLGGGRPIWIVVLLLVPVWFQTFVASMTIDPRTACAAAMFVGFLRQPVHGKEPFHWYLSDLAVFLLCAGITVTQFAMEGDVPLSPLDKIRDVAFPYMVGRLFIRTTDDIQSILPTICLSLTILSAYALIEGVTRRNPIEIFLGRPWLQNVLESFDEVRWGMKRAYGPQTHSIYLGLTFAMMMPWAIEAAVESSQRRGPYWWRFVPVFALAGIVATGSRAAQLSVLIVFFAMFFQGFPRWRGVVLFIGFLAGIGFMAAREEVVELLGQYISEAREGVAYVKVNGELREYSGTKHRELLTEVYELAIEQNTWLGYGGKMRNMHKDPDMDERFESIDNHYLMWFLQYGYLGIILFGILALSFLRNLMPSLLWKTGPPGRLAGGLFGAMAGTLFAMRGVWFAADYAWVWLFCGGMSVCLARQSTGEEITPRV